MRSIWLALVVFLVLVSGFGPSRAMAQPTSVRFPSAVVPPTPFAAARHHGVEPQVRPTVAPPVESSVDLNGRFYRPVPRPAGAATESGTPGSGPALVVLPGCSGRMEPAVEAQLAGRFTQGGIAVLVVDSLTPRLLHPQCLWDGGQADRVADAIGALDYLAGLPDLDPERIAVLGFGRAGTAALSAVAGGGYPGSLSRHRFAAAIAFYPRCNATQGELAAPALIVIGGLDETSPVGWCRALPHRAVAVGPGAPEYLELQGAGHGFDLAGAADPAGRGWGQPDPVYREDADTAADTAAIRFLRRGFAR